PPPHAVLSPVPIAAGARLMIQDGSAPPITRIVASDTGVAHHHARPVLKASAAPAVRQPRSAPSQASGPPHPRRHRSEPESHRPAHPPRATHHPSDQAQQPRTLTSMMVRRAALETQAAVETRTAEASPKSRDLRTKPQTLPPA